MVVKLVTRVVTVGGRDSVSDRIRKWPSNVFRNANSRASRSPGVSSVVVATSTISKLSP